MPAPPNLDQVKKLLANGQTEAAADLLLELTNSTYQDYHRDAMLLKNRLEMLQQNSIEGILSHSDESIEWAKISRGIIGLVDNISKGERPQSEEAILKKTEEDGQHRLAAVLFTDIVGFTGMMSKNEALAMAAVKRHQQVLETTVANQKGKVLQYYGDGSLSIFHSALHAVQCAMDLQRQFRNAPVVPLRIGIHIGEILLVGGNVYGDGVNVASRIESLGTAGAVLFSKEVYRKIRNQPEFKTTSLGHFNFKGTDEELEVYAISNEDFPLPKREEMQGKLKAPKPENRFFSTGKLIAAVLLGILLAVVGWNFLPESQTDDTKPEAALDTYSGKVVFAFDQSAAGGAVVNFGNGLAVDTADADGVFKIALPEALRDSTVYVQIFFDGERKVAHQLNVGQDFFRILKIPN